MCNPIIDDPESTNEWGFTWLGLPEAGRLEVLIRAEAGAVVVIAGQVWQKQKDHGGWRCLDTDKYLGSMMLNQLAREAGQVQ